MENGGGGTTEDRSGSSSYQVMRMAIAIGVPVEKNGVILWGQA